jgi:soluble P-type ATPase
MFELEIPGFGEVKLKYLVSDFTGTLSVDGKLLSGVKERMTEVSRFLDIHILTADTFGKAKDELKDIKCEIHILTGNDHDIQKEDYIKKLNPEYVIAFGNGNNDRKMLKTAKIGVAVCLNEGCSIDAIKSADIIVTSTIDALDLLLSPKRLKATLRY